MNERERVTHEERRTYLNWTEHYVRCHSCQHATKMKRTPLRVPDRNCEDGQRLHGLWLDASKRQRAYLDKGGPK